MYLYYRLCRVLPRLNHRHMAMKGYWVKIPKYARQNQERKCHKPHTTKFHGIINTSRKQATNFKALATHKINNNKVNIEVVEDYEFNADVLTDALLTARKKAFRKAGRT